MTRRDLVLVRVLWVGALSAVAMALVIIIVLECLGDPMLDATPLVLR